MHDRKLYSIVLEGGKGSRKEEIEGEEIDGRNEKFAVSCRKAKKRERRPLVTPK